MTSLPKKRKRLARVSLLHKALVLVLVPFAVNSIWIALLFSALDRTQQLVVSEQKLARTIDRLNAMNSIFYDALSEIYSYALLGRQEYRDSAIKKLTELRTIMSELNSLLDDSKETRTFLADVDLLTNRAMQQVNSEGMPGPREEVKSFLSKVSGLRRMLHVIYHDNASVKNLLADYKHRLSDLERSEARSRQTTQNLSVYGLAANFLLALVMVLWFIRDLSRRLTVLVDNASRLPKRQPLNDKFSGSDELSYLDESMHAASEELIRAWNHRDSLVAMVAHDLRSPLNSCEISLQLMEFPANLDEDTAAQIRTVRSNIHRLLGLISDLLTVNNLEGSTLAIQKSPQPLNEIVESAILALQSLADAKQIVIDNETGAELVDVDKERIVQVLLNYLSNAIKFSPKKSTIQIIAERQYEKIMISVKDQGIGLNDLERNRVFDKFFQAKTDESVKGFGLGLAICKLIVETHGGSVGVESAPGRGSRFWFTVDAAK